MPGSQLTMAPSLTATSSWSWRRSTFTCASSAPAEVSNSQTDNVAAISGSVSGIEPTP